MDESLIQHGFTSRPTGRTQRRSCIPGIRSKQLRDGAESHSGRRLVCWVNMVWQKKSCKRSTTAISISVALALLIGTFCSSSVFARGSDPQFVTVFEHGKEGFPEYRIPSLLVTKHGVLLAFAEARLARSDHAQNKIVLKRSLDGGRSWKPLQVVHDAGSNVLVNPCAVALDSGRVMLIYEFFPAGYHSRVISTNIQLLSPGLHGDSVSRTLLQWSDDDGATWSAPRDVTSQTKRATKITSTTSGPGIGIQLQRGPHKGRILVPSSESWWVGKVRFNNVYACLSDDGGRTWRLGHTAPNNVGLDSEVQMVELADGSVLLNARSLNGHKCRKVAVSRDGGETWSPLQDQLQLPEPECMASIVRYSWPESVASRILFANPDSTTARTNGTIRVSFDEGKSWPVAKTIWPGSYGYSCLAALPDGNIGLLFEANNYEQIKFARFGLSWLLTKSKSSGSERP